MLSIMNLVRGLVTRSAAPSRRCTHRLPHLELLEDRTLLSG
jgi:hypothetical protein